MTEASQRELSLSTPDKTPSLRLEHVGVLPTQLGWQTGIYSMSLESSSFNQNRCYAAVKHHHQTGTPGM